MITAEHLLCSRYYCKHLIHITHLTSILTLTVISCYRWGNWGPETWFKHTQGYRDRYCQSLASNPRTLPLKPRFLANSLIVWPNLNWLYSGNLYYILEQRSRRIIFSFLGASALGQCLSMEKWPPFDKHARKVLHQSWPKSWCTASQAWWQWPRGECSLDHSLRISAAWCLYVETNLSLAISGETTASSLGVGKSSSLGSEQSWVDSLDPQSHSGMESLNASAQCVKWRDYKGWGETCNKSRCLANGS